MLTSRHWENSSRLSGRKTHRIHRVVRSESQFRQTGQLRQVALQERRVPSLEKA